MPMVWRGLLILSVDRKGFSRTRNPSPPPHRRTKQREGRGRKKNEKEEEEKGNRKRGFSWARIPFLLPPPLSPSSSFLQMGDASTECVTVPLAPSLPPLWIAGDHLLPGNNQGARSRPGHQGGTADGARRSTSHLQIAASRVMGRTFKSHYH